MIKYSLSVLSFVACALATAGDGGPANEGSDSHRSTICIECSRVDLEEPCGILDLADVIAFIEAFSGQDWRADLNNDRVFDLNDIIGFVSIFQSSDCGVMPPSGYGFRCYGGPPYCLINFHKGNSTYAFGQHRAFEAYASMAGLCLMLGAVAIRRR
jgi:hypothetical protein